MRTLRIQLDVIKLLPKKKVVDKRIQMKPQKITKHWGIVNSKFTYEIAIVKIKRTSSNECELAILPETCWMKYCEIRLCFVTNAQIRTVNKSKVEIIIIIIFFLFIKKSYYHVTRKFQAYL